MTDGIASVHVAPFYGRGLMGITFDDGTVLYEIVSEKLAEQPPPGMVWREVEAYKSEGYRQMEAEMLRILRRGGSGRRNAP